MKDRMTARRLGYRQMLFSNALPTSVMTTGETWSMQDSA
jgi:hypothetical protein